MIDPFINVCFATIIIPFVSVYGPRYTQISEEVLGYLFLGSLACNFAALAIFPYALFKFRKSSMDNVWQLFLYFNAMAYSSKLSESFKLEDWVHTGFRVTKRGCQAGTAVFFAVLIIRYIQSIRTKVSKKQE